MSMWKHIFNAKSNSNACGFHDACKMAKDSGYNFIAFNGNIFFLDEDKNIHNTGLTVDDIT